MNYAAAGSGFGSAADCYVLRDGSRIPCLGFGTWQVFDDAGGSDVIREAVAAGYRHFDAAAFYHSEKSVGTAVRESGLPRSDFFITSKVWKDNLGRAGTLASVKQTLRDLRTDYLDLLLIHWPRASHREEHWMEVLAETWQCFIDLKRDGLVKSIGTANFLPHHFKALHTEEPVINQIEFHPGYLQPEAVAWCRERDILVEAWAPLGRGALLQELQIKKLAAARQVSPAQLCLKFCLNQGTLPLVKSADAARMRLNLQCFAFRLSDEDMSLLSNLPDKTAWSGEHPDLAIPGDD